METGVASDPVVLEWFTWAFRGLLGLLGVVLVSYFHGALSRLEERQSSALEGVSRRFGEQLASSAAALESVRADQARDVAAIRGEQVALRRELAEHAVALARDSERWEGVRDRLAELARGVRRIESQLLAGRRAIPAEPGDGEG